MGRIAIEGGVGDGNLRDTRRVKLSRPIYASSGGEGEF